MCALLLVSRSNTRGCEFFNGTACREGKDASAANKYGSPRVTSKFSLNFLRTRIFSELELLRSRLHLVSGST